MGGVEQHKEACRDGASVQIARKRCPRCALRGLRMLRRSPIFTAVAVLSLALGIGANTAIFQLIDAIRLRSLPIANPQELAEVRADGVHGVRRLRMPSTRRSPIRCGSSFEPISRPSPGCLPGGDAGFLVGRGGEVRGTRSVGERRFLSGARHHAGARAVVCAPDDDRRGCGAGSAVVSYAFWQRYFGGETPPSAARSRFSISRSPSSA